jgi:tetratricopeptide (TPR) repeat protein
VQWAEVKLRELLRAYEVLSDAKQRFAYDRKLRARSGGMSFVERMMRKRDDHTAQAKLILHFLLEGEFERAIDLHESLLLRYATFSMAEHLDDRDYLDSLFLLGEAYEGREQWRTAARFYWEAYELEQSGPHKRYFFEELKDRLRIIFSQRLIRGLSPEDALKNYRRALALGIGNRDAALIYQKIAAIQSRLGRPDEAVKALNKAQNLCPGMKTIDLLKIKIAGN